MGEKHEKHEWADILLVDDDFEDVNFDFFEGGEEGGYKVEDLMAKGNDHHKFPLKSRDFFRDP